MYYYEAWPYQIVSITLSTKIGFHLFFSTPTSHHTSQSPKNTSGSTLFSFLKRVSVKYSQCSEPSVSCTEGLYCILWQSQKSAGDQPSDQPSNVLLAHYICSCLRVPFNWSPAVINSYKTSSVLMWLENRVLITYKANVKAAFRCIPHIQS